MNAISLSNVLDQKRPVSHLLFLLFSLLFAIGTALVGKINHSVTEIASAFILIFLQVEVFIFFGNVLFSKVNFDQSPALITRIVLSRFALFISLCLITSMALYLMLEYALAIIKGKSMSGILYNFFNVGFRVWFRSTISGLSGGALIFVILLWQTSLQREQKLREENLIFQNQTLRNQINPHFLFNSLNTLSALIPVQPESAEKFILRLSQMYRYILENSSKEAVPLPSELEFINNYFDLHRIRDDEKIRLVIDAPDADKFMILPVSLQILVENAIKHNMATRENPLNITIDLDDHYIVVRNNLQKPATKIKSTGIGLQNLSERARMATGRKIEVKENPGEFIVKVPLLT